MSIDCRVSQDKVGRRELTMRKNTRRLISMTGLVLLRVTNSCVSLDLENDKVFRT